jgi:hypothetical protein
MWPGTKDQKALIGNYSPSTSVGEILYSLAVAFPAANPFPIGASLMQATLSPQEAADLLFYLMNVMSTVSASTTTPSIKTISSFNRRGLDDRYGIGTAEALEERYRDSHFRGKTTKEWTKAVYQQKLQEMKDKLATLPPDSISY